MDIVARLERHRGISFERVSSYGKRTLTESDDLLSAYDGKVKVWSIDQRSCVATHSETEKTLWSVKWLSKSGKNEGFATAGANKSISFYREATGGGV